MQHNANALWQRYQAAKTQASAKYARDIAAEMGISEAELTAARVGHDAVRLQDDIRAIIAGLEGVGETKCICRNEYAVHEQVGQFTHQHLSGHAGLVLNPRALDLRLFLSQWASAFHLSDNGRQSIQFFDHHGDALLKVYATAQTDMTAWEALIVGQTQADPAPLAIRPVDTPRYAASADGAALENEWRAMTDVHQFFGLLRKYNLSRQQAFRLVSDDLACRIDHDALPHLLETIREEGNEIMIFVGNRGCVQIFTGALEKLAPDYERRTGDKIVIIPGPSMGTTPQAIPNRLARGEKADVVIMVGDALEKLEKAGQTQPGSRTELADSPVGMVVKKGADVPDISSEAALRKTLLQASSIAYSDSASGRYVSQTLFKKMGIEKEVAGKATMVERIPVASEVAKGKYAVGFQQVSELLPVQGVTFIGKIPDNLQYITRFAGAVTRHAEHPVEGKALLTYLASPPSRAVIQKTGMIPVTSGDTAR